MSRVECNYESENGRFILDCDFAQQYHNYYRKRLSKARPLLEYNCRRKWDPLIGICPLSEVSNCDSEQCIVIGTIFKRMRLQPNVLDELCSGNFDISSEKYLGHYTSQDDTLTLEDEEESIQLVGNVDPKKLVTGVTIALLGRPLNDGGRFLVDDTCFVACCEPITSTELIPFIHQTQSKPVFLLIVSGLGFHHDMKNNMKLTRALQDMIDFIWGGDKFSDDERSSRVARVLVVGDCLRDDRFSTQDDVIESIAQKMKVSRQVKDYKESIRAVNHMDDFFAQISKTIDVDVMPGQSDPSSHLLPQQPFHPCMFPKSSMFPTFNCTTNPHHAIYNGVEVLATAGQNVDIISKFSGINDPIEIMKSHLEWGNSAPSAPDNLYSVPYEDEDPFIIEAAPDIYITGCQESFRSSNYVSRAANRDKIRTLLLTIPVFHVSFSCVLVDLETLEPQLLKFD